MGATRREFLAGSLGAVALGAAGCSSSSTPKKSPPSGKIAGSITIWDYLSDANTKVEDGLFRAAFPAITLKRVHQPYANFNQLVQAALASRSAPDILFFNSGGSINEFSSGLERLDDRLTSDMKKNLAFGPLMSPDLDTSKGTYGLPLDLLGAIFFYNKELFTRAGLDPEKPPTSWPQLQDAAAKLMAAGITPFSEGDKEGLGAQLWFSTLAPMHLTQQQTVDLGHGKLKFNSDPVRQVFEKYVEIAKAGWFQKTWRTDSIFQEASDYFTSGKAAMTVLLPGLVSTYHPVLKDKLGIFLGLSLTDEAKVNYLPYGPGFALAMSKQSSNKDAAFAWLAWRTSPATQQRDLNDMDNPAAGANAQPRLPTDKRVKPGPAATPLVREMIDALQSTTIFPGAQTLWKLPVYNATTSNFGPVVDGHRSLDDALDALDKAQATAK